MSEAVRNLALPQGKQLYLFGYVAMAWLVGSSVVSFFLEAGQESGTPVLALAALVGFWALSVLDLVALTRFLSVIFKWMSPDAEKRPLFLIQAMFWGLIKVVCLGLFFITLLKGQKIPMHGLLLGMGTLGVVPVVGGFIWSQRILQDA